MDSEIYQAKNDTCGYSALRTFLIELTHQKGWRYLPRLHDGAMDLRELSTLASDAGVTLAWKRANYANAIYEAKRFPILLLLNEGKQGHLVTLLKKKKNMFLIADPKNGKEWISGALLQEKWTLVFGEGKIEKKETPPKKKRLIDPFALPLLLAFLFLELVFFFLGISFLQEDPRLLYAIIFLTLGVIFFAVREGSSFYFMHQFEEKHLSLIAKGSKADDYLLFQKAKSTFLFSPSSAFASLLIAFTLYVYLALWGVGYALAGALLILLEVLYCPLFATLKKEERRLERREALLLSRPFERKFARKIGREGEKLALKMRVVDLITYLPLFLLSFLALYQSETSSFYAYITAFLALFLFEKSLRPALHYPLGKKERRKIEDAFFERFLSLSEPNQV